MPPIYPIMCLIKWLVLQSWKRTSPWANIDFVGLDCTKVVRILYIAGTEMKLTCKCFVDGEIDKVTSRYVFSDLIRFSFKQFHLLQSYCITSENILNYIYFSLSSPLKWTLCYVIYNVFLSLSVPLMCVTIIVYLFLLIIWTNKSRFNMQMTDILV